MGAQVGRRLALTAAVLGLAAQAPGAAAAPLLPDLDQLAPTQLSVTPVPGTPVRYFLAFDSRIANGPRGGAGVGPLIMRAHRPNTAAPMVADQVIRHTDGSETFRRGIGRLEFAISADHRHWHYRGFDRYELRRASDGKRIAPDNKTGFCMPDPLFTPDYCGVNQPGSLSLQEGLGPGYLDLYQANLEGQNIDVTGAPKGLYHLVHRVNADSSICESNLSNNAAATKLRMWPNGYGVAPYYSVLGDIEQYPSKKLQRAPKNCPLDRRAPRMRIRIPAGQHVKRARSVVAYVRCNERCSIRISGKVSGRGLRPAVKAAGARKRVAVRARLAGGSWKAAKKAARARRALRFRLTVRAADRVGNRSRAARRTVWLLP